MTTHTAASARRLHTAAVAAVWFAWAFAVVAAIASVWFFAAEATRSNRSSLDVILGAVGGFGGLIATGFVLTWMLLFAHWAQTYARSMMEI